MSGLGFSASMMQGVMAANTALLSAKAQNSALVKMEGRANILKAEIKSGYGDTESKKEELAEVEERQKWAAEMQQNTLNQANDSLEANAPVSEDTSAPKAEEAEDGAQAAKSKESAASAKTETEKKAAAKELKKLSQTFDSYSFAAVDYVEGMKYGSASTTNVAISPEFLAKMSADPQLAAKYQGKIAGMQAIDRQFAGVQGMTAQGWSIDKNGGVSKWGMIAQENSAQAQQLQQQMWQAGKDALGDSFRKATVMDASKERAGGSAVAGMLVDRQM